MLIEFSVENHRAIREKQFLSMVPADADVVDRLEPPYHVAETGLSTVPRILIDACLFGANGSGKTSLVVAMDFLVKFVRNSSDGGPGRRIPVDPFLLSPSWRNQPSEFEVTFIHEGTIYQYGFTLTQERVLSEWLSVKVEESNEWLSVQIEESSEWIVIFERQFDCENEHYNIMFGKPLNDTDSDWLSRTRPNALLLSTAVQFNAGGSLESAYRWITEHFKLFRYPIQIQFMDILLTDSMKKDGKKKF